MVKRSLPVRWRANFLTGFFIVLPAVISFAVIKWVFGTVSSVTDLLLFFLPKDITHQDGGKGDVLWYWSLVALVLAVLLTSLLGRMARNYFGRKLIEWSDGIMLAIPLFNKVYAAIKQVNEAFSSGSKNSFKTVVRVEFPRPGIYSIGFLTSEEQHSTVFKTSENLVCVFIPTTPNPTSGFMVLVPSEQVTQLDMSVADGVKYIVSLGSISPVPHPDAKPND